MANSTAKHREPIVPMMLNGGRVLKQFRTEVWSAADRAGVSVNEFCLRAVGKALVEAGADIPGVFTPGDINTNGQF